MTANGHYDLPVAPPVLVLSDLHMAHPASYLDHPRQLTPLFENVRTVIFNGDTCELANLGRKREATDLLAATTEICRQRGIQPYFMTGNHDPAISNLHYLDLFDGKVFVTHGDGLHPAIAPWSHEAPAIRAERRRLLMGHDEPKTLEQQLLIAKLSSLVAALYDRGSKHGFLGRAELVSRFIRHPRRILITLLYWANVAHYAHAMQQRFRPDCKLMLIGHTHRAGVWRNRDYTLINTGSYQPLSYPLGVWLDHDHARVHRLIERKGEYHAGRQVYHRDF